MSLEVERKWRVRQPPPAMPAGTAIRQGYLAIGIDEVRVRQKGAKLLLTHKKGEGLVRHETEVGLTEEQFRTLWPATEGRRVEKTRHPIAYGDLTIEVDVYEGTLAGLVVAEVEFPSPDAANDFDVPAWFDEELTGAVGWSNARLALDGIPGEPMEGR